MRKQRLYILITIISLLVMVLVCVQIAWLRSANIKAKEALALKVNSATTGIEQQLEKSIDCITMFTKYHVRGGEGFYISKQAWEGKGFTGKVDTVDMYYDYTEFRDKNYNKEVPYKYSNFNSPFPADVEILINVHFLPGDSQSNIYTKASSISRENFKDVISSTTPVSELFDMNVADSIIRYNLNKEGITRHYGFGFISKKDNRVVYAKGISDSATLYNTPHAVGMFVDNRFIGAHVLAIVFTEQPAWYSVNSLLLLSVLVIALLTGAFYTFIRLYLKQDKLSEMKTDFINNLTHEFNTPMANISLALETIEDNKTEIDPKLKHILSIISSESQRLHSNIERALHVSILEKGAIALRNDIVDISELLVSVEPSYTLQCEQHGGRLGIYYEGNCKITGDETHLLNCICNLLDNAIKYRQGPPDIQLMAKEQEKNVCLIISDNGIGMNAETLKHIFDKFYRAHEGDTHNTKGFGLGLNYVKGIVDAMGGKIEVWSKPGVGSKFTIYFPKKKIYA